MSRGAAITVIADLTASLVDEYDAVSLLTHLVSACSDLLGADVGILVTRPGATRADGAPGDEDEEPGLELLASSSHRAAVLELYQKQVEEGPALDAVVGAARVVVTSSDDMRRRWPVYGPLVVEQGRASVHAEPIVWRGVAVGALNIFRAESGRLGPEAVAMARAFADVSAIGIVHAQDRPGVDQVSRGVHAALEGRIVVEQAKGVVAVHEGVDPADAFGLLRDHADQTGARLSELAAEVVARAQHGTRWDGSANASQVPPAP